MRSFKSGFKNWVFSGMIAAASLCGSFAGAQADDRVPYDRALITKLPSTTEDVGIAFLKMSNNFPDFSAIVKDSKAYTALNPLAQQDYLSKMTGKLQNSYVTFSPNKNDLIVRVKVNALFKKLPNGEGVLKIRTFPSDPVYFPFYFAKYPIAMIVQGMELFREIHLDKADTDVVYSRLSLSGDATLLLQLHVLAADDRKTITLDNIPQYPLLTEISYIGLLNAQTEQIWAWRNPKLTSRNASGAKALVDMVPADKSFSQ
ncbi:MAG: hypothetical protein A3J37_00215 [Alphaproteobacteria bacterium RIFCSPHIGHO2_12_FULL_45_9]|nr:MAG: hypothetical protein A3B66_09645 [Alphaproteobacteria bacterium RIFCSPHIGHO2_02_FULL_46_13]OFW95779.1 MAG: hypothetical protein A3J37_00215 [Alphaproteobacteria bacterium RIFCSPHIGHO2_12_FULL_45_9]